MNVYDAAHQLAKAIKESEEYSKYKGMDILVKADSDAYEKLESFQQIQIDLQTKQMMGQELDEQEIAQAQSIFEELNKNELVSQFFEAEMRLNQMMGDVSKILGDVMNFNE